MRQGAPQARSKARLCVMSGGCGRAQADGPARVSCSLLRANCPCFVAGNMLRATLTFFWEMNFWRAPVLSVSLAARGCCAYFGCRRQLCSAPHLHAASAGCPARAARVRVVAGCAEQLNPAERSGAVRRSTHRLPCTSPCSCFLPPLAPRRAFLGRRAPWPAGLPCCPGGLLLLSMCGASSGCAIRCAGAPAHSAQLAAGLSHEAVHVFASRFSAGVCMMRGVLEGAWL